MESGTDKGAPTQAVPHGSLEQAPRTPPSFSVAEPEGWAERASRILMSFMIAAHMAVCTFREARWAQGTPRTHRTKTKNAREQTAESGKSIDRVNVISVDVLVGFTKATYTRGDPTKPQTMNLRAKGEIIKCTDCCF